MIRNVCVFIFLSCLSWVHADPESDQLARIIYKESMVYESLEESIQISLQSEPLVNLSQEEKTYYRQKNLDPKVIEEAYIALLKKLYTKEELIDIYQFLQTRTGRKTGETSMIINRELAKLFARTAFEAMQDIVNQRQLMIKGLEQLGTP